MGECRGLTIAGCRRSPTCTRCGEQRRGTAAAGGPWFQRLSRPILFLVASLALVGAYLAFTVPVSVFPQTDFPRIVIGIDNGVTPIDQMLVTVTRPIEEAV